MSLLERKSQKLSYSLGGTGRLALLICTLLIMSGSFMHWFFRGAVFDSAKQQYDDDYHQSMIFFGLIAVGTGLSGIKITHCPEDRDP
jgi:hypothetical protein